MWLLLLLLLLLSISIIISIYIYIYIYVYIYDVMCYNILYHYIIILHIIMLCHVTLHYSTLYCCIMLYQSDFGTDCFCRIFRACGKAESWLSPFLRCCNSTLSRNWSEHMVKSCKTPVNSHVIPVKIWPLRATFCHIMQQFATFRNRPRGPPGADPGCKQN